MNIVHRDLKTENILYSKDKKSVKLIDFGMANFLNHADVMKDIAGTPYYISPEVFRGNYDKRCDLWSIGVVAFFLLSGQFPFNGENLDQLQKKICSCDYDFDDDVWQSISKEAKKFIMQLIEPNVKNRLSCE